RERRAAMATPPTRDWMKPGTRGSAVGGALAERIASVAALRPVPWGMRIRTVLSPLVLILAASGCSDDFSGPAVGEFDELCGKNEPLRILPLDSTRVPAAVPSWTFGERYVYGLGFGNEAEER